MNDLRSSGRRPHGIQSFDQSVALVDVMETRERDDRSWFWRFLDAICSSPDLDYSQFERLESKRTRQQMEREEYI